MLVLDMFPLLSTIGWVYGVREIGELTILSCGGDVRCSNSGVVGRAERTLASVDSLSFSRTAEEVVVVSCG